MRDNCLLGTDTKQQVAAARRMLHAGQRQRKNPTMPRIHHLALWVSDLDALCAFYAAAFSARVGDRYENPAKGFASRFVTFEDGARLEFMTSRTLALPTSEPGAQRMGLTHIAISLGSEAAVDELTARLRATGVPVLDGPRHTGDGYYESVVLDPEGNRIELTV